MVHGCRSLAVFSLVLVLAGAGLACQRPPIDQGPTHAAASTAPQGAAAPAPTAAAPIKVRLSQPVAALGFTSIYVARHLGYFADEGLDLEVLTMGGGGPDMQALIAGDVEFNASATTILIAAHQEGTPLVGVVSLLNRPIMNVAMHREVAEARGIGPQTPLRDRLAALSGLTIGVTRLGSLTDQLANYYARKAGLTVGQDVTILAVGAGAPMMASLEFRRVDVIISASAELGEAINQGLAVMLSEAASGEDPDLADFLQQLVVVRPDYARDHPDVVRKMARAVVRANRWVTEHSVDEIAAVVAHYLGQTPEDFLVRSIKLAAPPDGRMTERGILTNYEMMDLTGSLKSRPPWQALVTNDYLPQ
jgi:NitT/TauT family transport system substrate-binding protein